MIGDQGPETFSAGEGGFVIRAVPPEGEPVPAGEVVDDDLEADEDEASEPVGWDDGWRDRPV